jgi:transketolase
MTTEGAVLPFTPADPQTWDLATSYRLASSFVAGEVLADIADEDERVVVLTADLKWSNRIVDFERRHPGRFVNTGISEQNMITMAAGMATFGHVPYVAGFASFIGLLCAEQIRTDLAYPELPVRILAHHTGISLGFYGTSHHATEDLAFMRSIAGLTVICPCDAASLTKALWDTVDRPGPVYFRIGRGRDQDVNGPDVSRFEVGKLSVLKDGTDLVIIANGITVAPALEAAAQLEQAGVSVAVADAHTIRPFDADTFCAIAGEVGRVLVAEEHNVIGGVASACADALVDRSVQHVVLKRLGIPDEYAPIGPPTRLYEHYRLDAAGILKEAQDLLAMRERQ